MSQSLVSNLQKETPDELLLEAFPSQPRMSSRSGPLAGEAGLVQAVQWYPRWDSGQQESRQSSCHDGTNCRESASGSGTAIWRLTKTRWRKLEKAR